MLADSEAIKIKLTQKEAIKGPFTATLSTAGPETRFEFFFAFPVLRDEASGTSLTNVRLLPRK